MTLDQVFSLDDGFFHIRFAELLREKGISAFTDFQAIYYSRMSIGHEYLVYYNFLFYLALLPFTFITPLVVGMKMYGVIALSVSFTVMYVFLRKVSVRYPFLWTLLFLMVLMQSGWLSRFTFARPFTLSPVFLVLMLLFIHEKKHKLSASVAFLYFYWHTATFFFPLALALGYFLFEQFYGKKPDWKMVGWPLLGTFSALFLAYIISPGVIAYLRDVIFPVFYDSTLTKTTGIAEGSEVYGRNLLSTFSSFFWFLAALFITGSYEVGRYIRGKIGIQKTEDRVDETLQPLRAMLFMAAIIFFSAVAVSGRFLDYFVYFCLLYVAIAVTDVAKFIEIRGTVFRKSSFAGLLIIAIFLFTSLTLGFYDSLATAHTQLIARGPAEWLNANVEKEAIIFNVNWDAFPVLYYFSGDRFRYVTGLEPRFLYDLDPRMYWVWNNIASGVYCEATDCTGMFKEREKALLREESRRIWYERQGSLIADAVSQVYKSDILVTSVDRKDLLAVLDNSTRFRKEYFDPENSAYAVYRLVEPGGAPSKK